MPKIPTFEARGSIEQLAGTTSNIQLSLNNTLANALAPVTQAVVDFKIKENEVQNKTEALKLKNDYLSESVLLEDQINQDKILSVNKEAANKFLKEKNNAYIEKYSALASNSAVKTMFTNSALADVSKQIFSVDAEISKNILVQADEVFIDTKEKLFSKAYLKGGIYKQTLQKDTEKLIIDSYKSRISAPELEIMLGNVKGEIDYFDGMQDVQQTPRAAFYALKDEKNYSDITTKQRFALIERASVVIRDQLTTEWENHTAMIDAGKEPPEFNMKLAQEVFGGEVADKMLQQESVRKDAVENTSLIMTSPQKDVNELVENIIAEQYEMFGETQAKKNQTYYESILAKRNEALLSDPVQFIRATNDNINSLFQEIQNDTNAESRSKSSIILAQELIKEQKRLGVPLENQKVMSDSMALGFIKEYNDLGFEGKSKERQLKLQSLQFQYGDLSNNALQQLIKAGLPTGAESALVLGDAKTFDIFMSFDDPEKIKAITNYLTDQDDPDISLKKIRAAIVSESDFKDIDNIISRNTPFNNSKTLVKMDQIKETLSLYAANLMRNNPGMSVNNAAKEASLLFSDNYQIEDTYYFPKNIPGINQKQRDFTISKLENIKFNYIKQHFKPVAYESSVEGKTDLELTERMNYNIIENGEWRNHPNGEGFVFGIVLSGNSFGILKNEAGEELFVSYDDDSLILPGGSNTIIDMNIPTEQQKKQFRGYYGYADKMKQENTTFGQRTNLDNNEMQNALEDSGASTVEIPNPLSVIGEAMIGQVESSEINLNSAKRIILDEVGGDIYNEKSQNNLQKFTAAVFDVESNSGDKDFLLNKSSATGFFQFKTKDNLDKKTGKVKLDENGIPLKSSFETALSRLETQYKRFDTNIPNWVKKAKQTKNPTKFILEELTYDQQEELFLMNIYGQKNSDALIKAMLNGNMEKAMELYAKFHHTKLNVVNDETIKEKFNKAYK
jgi:hypothetical protein